VVGVLGGYTTFSTFSLDILQMFENGHGVGAAIYALSSVVFSVIAVMMGLYLMRAIWV